MRPFSGHSPFVFVWENTIGAEILSNPEIALVAFHTTFNLLGAILILPFTAQFAALMIKLIPDTRPHHARGLDKALLKEPGVALLAAQKVIVTEFLTLMININLIPGNGLL